MGRRVVIQPNGLFGLFSSYVDDYVIFDMNEQEVEDEFVREAVEKAQQRAKDEIRRARKSPDQWWKMLSTIKQVHGEERMAEAEKEMCTCPDDKG